MIELRYKVGIFIIVIKKCRVKLCSFSSYNLIYCFVHLILSCEFHNNICMVNKWDVIAVLMVYAS